MAKQLVPVANKPVIEYGIEAIREAGIQDFGIIVGDTGPAVEAALGDGSRWGIHLTFIPQAAPLGLAHAVQTAEPFLGDDDFIMYLGDNLLKSPITALVREFETHRPAATILLTPVPNPSDFGVAEMSGDRVIALEEKPAKPASNLALVGVYLFDHRVHEVIRTLKPSKRGEYEITDAIQGLIDRGWTVRSHIVEGWWKDTGTVEAMLEANQLVLQDLVNDVQGEVDAASRLSAPVSVGAGSVIRQSLIEGPVKIGERCTIENCYIGPYTAIDSNTTLRNSEVEYSIILSDCLVENVPARIRGSLVGRGVIVRKPSDEPSTCRLVLGDSSSVTLP
jgi:glucose-1-phosphate thymidylyltransferase